MGSRYHHRDIFLLLLLLMLLLLLLLLLLLPICMPPSFLLSPKYMLCLNTYNHVISANPVIKLITLLTKKAFKFLSVEFNLSPCCNSLYSYYNSLKYSLPYFNRWLVHFFYSSLVEFLICTIHVHYKVVISCYKTKGISLYSNSS